MSNLLELLKRKSLKATTSRVSILKIIEDYGHISIEELYLVLKKTHPTISLNTIYLNIDKLKQNGIINQISIDNKRAKYEIKKREHIHLICTICSGVIDKELPINIVDSLELGDNFRSEKISINIYGVCKECS